MGGRDQFRTYDRASSAVFRKTNEEFGGLSNMAAGFPLEVNGLAIRSAEALYQACRFPHRPELQRHIIDQRSPMTAKMVGKPHRHDSRRDWDRVRVAIMRWALRVKLAQNWSAFGDLLLATGERPIVEDSRRDDFWGAKRVDSRTFAGMNVLGRLLMELREELREHGTALLTVEPPALEDFLLDGRPIEVIRGAEARSRLTVEDQRAKEVRQPSLFAQQLAESQESEPTITHLAPYPAYRDTGVPWLDEVPDHWEVRRLGQVGSLSKGTGGSKEDEVPEGVPCIRYGQLYTTYTRFIERARSYVSPERADAYTPIRFGDVLFAGSGETIEEIGKSAVNLMEGDVRCGGDVILFRPGIAIDPRFLGYATDCPPVAAQKATMGRGITIMHLYADELKYLAIPLPPSEEQAAIVRYLDHVDRRIRRYIRAKQRLIALLEEQKQAIIHRAVTRGLDPDVPLKPSGMEWLGDIPAHWDIWRSKRVFRPSKELARPGDVQLAATQAYGVIPQEEYELRVGRKVTKILRHLDKRKHVELNDFVISMRSFQGGLERAWATGCIRSSYVVLRAGVSADPGFFRYLFKSRAYISALQSTANFIRDGQDLSFENFAAVDLPVPPIDEQRRIALAVEQATANNEQAAESARDAIRLLREYQTRLIAGVVTGKLDVREAAARLPEETGKPEPLDDLDLPEDDLDDLDGDEAEAELAEAVT